MLKWQDKTEMPDLLQQNCVSCGILDALGNLIPPTAEIYVNIILQAAVTREWIIKSLATKLEAIFTVCGGISDVEVQQCPLLLKKWIELILGWRQTILGLIVDLNRSTVEISDDYPLTFCQASLQAIEKQMAFKQKILSS